MENDSNKEIFEGHIENKIQFIKQNSTLEKLKKIQLLIKEESSLKEICNEI